MDRISTIKDRILTFLEVEGIRKADFYTSTGLSDSNFKGKNRLSQPGGDMIVKILTTYPNISADWLIMGKGDMLRSKEISPQRKAEPAHLVPENSHEGIPLIPLSAMAGAFTGETSVMEYECERFVVPTFKGAEFLISVKGSSMYPKYNSGDIVACKRLPMDDIFFQWNKVYVLDTDQGPLIKRVKPGSDKDHVLIVSDNERYEPFELPLNRIYHVALVIGVIRLE